MSVDRSHEAENDAQRERLRSLVGRLNDEQLARPMPAGWTVAAQLAHVGFWDARAVFALGKWARGVEPPPGDYEPDDPAWINDSAKPLCLALAPRAAAQLSLRLAEEADRGIAALNDEMVEKIRVVGPFNISRAEHRREHLDDIERALGAPTERR
ncbi:MAG TPA: DinB family protein [Candidatus Limnocylindria bacterium]|nr:DinB family protein [Candidatus Limnocylindria bacterium]